jgi:hypothetical protein
MTPRRQVFHGLAIKRLADAPAIAALMRLPEAQVAAELQTAVATGRAVEARGGYTLTPLARVALEAGYGADFAALRGDAAFIEAYQRFERINKALKAIITDWQTMDVRGERVANDHSDPDHDAKIIDRLAGLHDQIEPILKTMIAHLTRFAIYLEKLTEALDRVDDGEIEWVSDIRRESYHTVWFELHEDLLRIMGTVRDD